MATQAEVQTMADDATCVVSCVNEKQLLAMAVYLLFSQLNPGVPMTQSEVQSLSDDSSCIAQCMSNKLILAAMVQLLFEGGGGGGVAVNPYQNIALSGAQPATDGSVTKYLVYDTDTSLRWYNSSTLASPVWNNI